MKKNMISLSSLCNNINCPNEVKLFGVTIDYRMKFDFQLHAKQQPSTQYFELVDTQQGFKSAQQKGWF